MPSELFMNDPQKIWQRQPTEAFKMSANELQRKTEDRRRKARFEVRRQVATCLLVSAFFGWALVRVHKLIPPTYGLLSRSCTYVGYGLLSLWGLYAAYQMYKWIWPDTLSPDANLETTLQSYRGQLEKQGDFGQRIGLILIPCFAGMLLVFVPRLMNSTENIRTRVLNSLPLVMLLVIWLITFLYSRKRRKGKLQHEIEQLRQFEREYPA